jgi:hypothetical protein
MRFFAVMGVGAVFGLGPPFTLMVVVGVLPERILFTCCRRASSESICAMISVVSIAQFYARTHLSAIRQLTENPVIRHRRQIDLLAAYTEEAEIIDMLHCFGFVTVTKPFDGTRMQVAVNIEVPTLQLALMKRNMGQDKVLHFDDASDSVEIL